MIVNLTYDYLHADELRGATQADHVVALDAHLSVVDDDVAIFDEPGFPVVERARSLLIWLRYPDPATLSSPRCPTRKLGL